MTDPEQLKAFNDHGECWPWDEKLRPAQLCRGAEPMPRFTPRTEDGERLSMRLSEQDMRKIGRGKGWAEIVTDLDTNKTYRVRAADCGLQCYCDAIAVEVRGYRQCSECHAIRQSGHDHSKGVKRCPACHPSRGATCPACKGTGLERIQ